MLLHQCYSACQGGRVGAGSGGGWLTDGLAVPHASELRRLILMEKGA